jgi:hypothetical protein
LTDDFKPELERQMLDTAVMAALGCNNSLRRGLRQRERQLLMETLSYSIATDVLSYFFQWAVHPRSCFFLFTLKVFLGPSARSPSAPLPSVGEHKVPTSKAALVNLLAIVLPVKKGLELPSVKSFPAPSLFEGLQVSNLLVV